MLDVESVCYFDHKYTYVLLPTISDWLLFVFIYIFA